MTREQAIIRLRRISNSLSQYCDANDCICGNCAKCYEALDMAEKALEQKLSCRNPRQVDRISRQDAIDTVMGFMPSLTTPDGCGQFDREIFEAQEMFVDIGQALNKLPSAQPFTTEQIQTMQELESAQVEKAFELGKADRPNGEWIKTEHCLTDNGYRKWIELECPFCGFRPVFELIDDMNYCPNCGARMESDGE